MNNKEVAQFIAEVEQIKKEAFETLQKYKAKEITTNEALATSKLLDVISKNIVTSITLDGIKQAIEHKQKEHQSPPIIDRNKGRNYERVKYR